MTSGEEMIKESRWDGGRGQLGVDCGPISYKHPVNERDSEAVRVSSLQLTSPFSTKHLESLNSPQITSNGQKLMGWMRLFA